MIINTPVTKILIDCFEMRDHQTFFLNNAFNEKSRHEAYIRVSLVNEIIARIVQSAVAESEEALEKEMSGANK